MDTVKRAPADCTAIWSTAKDYIDRLFAIHCARMGKPFWINKTPGFLNHLGGLSKLYTDAQYIHMLRDGRDVAVSNLSLEWGPATVRQAARRWRDLIRLGRKTAEARQLPVISVRYEDLIESPESVLGKIFSFMEVDAEPERLLSLLPIFRARTGIWRSAFSAQDREIFAREAGDLLIELGYEADHGWLER